MNAQHNWGLKNTRQTYTHASTRWYIHAYIC